MTRTLFVLLWCLASVTAAWAQNNKETIPSGGIGARAVARGSSIVGLGFTVAAVAVYHPTPPDKRMSLGAEWSAGWSYFPSNESSITGSLRLFELDYGARVRVRPAPGQKRFLVVGVGAALLRANVPIEPDFKRSYVGPYLSIGYEPKVGSITLGIDARVGIIAFGPTTVSIGMTATIGK